MSERRSFSAEEARNLLRRARTGTLATFNADDGTPYASLVNLATDVRGCPLILVSTLAWHTRNLQADPRASVMVAEIPPDGDALTGPRVTGRDSWLPQHAAHVSDVEALRLIAPDIADHDVFLSGTPGWVKVAELAAVRAGVPPEFIHIERFTY